MARRFEQQMLELAPDTVLVLFKADAEVIARRMREAPHTHQIVRERGYRSMCSSVSRRKSRRR